MHILEKKKEIDHNPKARINMNIPIVFVSSPGQGVTEPTIIGMW